MYLRVTHETRYAYTPTVATAQHMAHLRPRDDAQQQLLDHTLHISPTPSHQSESRDVFGNVRTFFSLQAAHEELTVTARSTVRALPPAALRSGAAEAGPDWEAVRERFRYRARGPCDAASEFAFPSPYVPRHDDFVRYARPSFGPGVALMDAARDLMHRIHADFTYEADSTEINTPAVEALAHRRGVCQDFAHIMLGCLRGMGLSARYVSGYMLTQPPPGKPRLVGSDASHAWVAVYVPDSADRRAAAPGSPAALAADGSLAPTGRWMDLDPTNDRSPAGDYVTLAVGRDFSDVSPLRGVLHGGAHHTLDVAVTVEPVAGPTGT